jgi:hypothetical protein
MAEQGKPEQPKTLEMRVAELEDKLSKVHITEEEMKAYHKVASLMGAQGVSSQIPQVCVTNCFRCIIYRCIIHPVCTCIFECSCGPCLPTTGSGGAGGGFGSLGS